MHVYNANERPRFFIEIIDIKHDGTKCVHVISVQRVLRAIVAFKQLLKPFCFCKLRQKPSPTHCVYGQNKHVMLNCLYGLRHAYRWTKVGSLTPRCDNRCWELHC